MAQETGFENVPDDMLAREEQTTIARMHRATRRGKREQAMQERERLRDVQREREDRESERTRDASPRDAPMRAPSRRLRSRDR